MIKKVLSSLFNKNGAAQNNIPQSDVILTLLILTSSLVYVSHAQQVYNIWEPPWAEFDNSVVVRTYYGDVRGFSVPWHVEDEAWNPDWDDQPRWFVQRVNCWLGVPYAEAPVGRLRFQRPRRPRWGNTWDSTYFRNACPQDIAHLREDIPTYPKTNISEDCLYMNVFAPNITWHSLDTLYPVVVFLHGGEFLYGSAQTYPGQVLVKQEVVVVTINYRLGALGYLTTEDEHAPGNWGLWDQQLALEFVRENIKAFRGDPNQITLMGDGAGAASAGHLIISPTTKAKKKFFHKAILMSGSDLAGMAFIDPFWRPRDYGRKLAEKLGCPTDDSYLLVECLRDNKTHSWEDIVRAQAKIVPHDGDLGAVWGPVPDGGYITIPILPETPRDIRRQEDFNKIPIIIGINQQDGTMKANRTVQGLGNGMFEVTYDEFLTRQLRSWRIMDRHWQRAKEAVRFQYTYWPDPENRTARAQEFINLVTDLDYGIGMDSVIKYHAPYESSYMYVWSYRSWEDYLPHWMGSSFSAQIPYVFGFPFMNETVLNETELVMRQWYTWEDRNMSDCTMIMWTNFIKYTVPTPNVTCNVTWDPYQEQNLTYLILDYHKHLWFRYNQAKYGFWRSYFPTLAQQDYLVPTATPTPSGYEFVYSTGILGAVLGLAFIAVGFFTVLLYQQSKQETEDEAFVDDRNFPLSYEARGAQSSRGSSMSGSLKQDLQVDLGVPEPRYDYRQPYGRQYQTHQYQSEV